MKISIVIPTRNRPKFLKKTLNNLSKNNFFFNEIIIVDASDKSLLFEKNNFPKIKKKIKFYKSIPSISFQRNLGLKKVNSSSNYIMFLDDDVNFKKDAFKKMYNFLTKNKHYSGIGFNLIINKKFIFDEFKKNKLFQILKVYDEVPGVVTSSGWHTKAINLKKNTEVEWLPTQAVIYQKKKIKRLKFENSFGKYSYLEDLDFSYQVNKIGKLVINYEAKYSSNNEVKRNFFLFGMKEVINRFIFVKKNKLNILNFNFGLLLLLIKNFVFILINNYKYLFRLIGNLFGTILILFKNKKINNFVD